MNEQQLAPQRRKIAEMTVEERREYNLQAKRKSREKEKLERQASQIPVASDYELPQLQKDQLGARSQERIATIAGELTHKLSAEDERMIHMMSDVLVAHERKWTKQVQSGVLYGNFHPDGAASEIIQHIHRNPSLQQSQKFNESYEQFLKLVRKLSQNEWFDQHFALEIEAELNGTYVLTISVQPEPAPNSPAPEPRRFPTDQQVLAESRLRLLESLGQLDPTARQYLYGGV